MLEPMKKRGELFHWAAQASGGLGWFSTESRWSRGPGYVGLLLCPPEKVARTCGQAPVCGRPDVSQGHRERHVPPGQHGGHSPVGGQTARGSSSGLRGARYIYFFLLLLLFFLKDYRHFIKEAISAKAMCRDQTQRQLQQDHYKNLALRAQHLCQSRQPGYDPQLR